MRKVVITEFLSLDGVMEAPDQWHFPFWNDEMGRFKSEELFASDAMLLGRVTYEGFAEAWPKAEHSADVRRVTEEHGDAGFDQASFTHRFNTMRKYVVSRTLKKAEWTNSQVITGDVAAAIARLKAEPGQDIVVHGSNTLSSWLLEQNLVDELRLLVHPIIVGKGKRFGDGVLRSLRLVESRTFATGVLALRYEPAAAA